MRGIDWKGLFAAIVVAAIGWWIVQPGAASTAEGRVTAFAARLGGIVPQRMADGSTLRSVTATGNTIVLNIDGRAPLEPAAGDAAIAAELCAGAETRDLITHGGRIRIEARTTRGDQLPSLTIDSCDPV